MEGINTADICFQSSDYSYLPIPDSIVPQEGLSHTYNQVNSVLSCDVGPTSERQIVKHYEAQRKREYRRKVAAKRQQEENAEVSDEKRRKAAESIGRFFLKETDGLEFAVAKDIFDRFSLLPSMKKFHGNSNAQVNQVIVSRVRSTLSMMKHPKSSDDMLVKRLCMLILMNSTSGSGDTPQFNLRAASKTLNIHHRNFYGAQSRLADMDDGQSLWAACREKGRSTVITEEVKELVFTFWLTNSRVSPNKKDVCRKRIGRKSYVQHPIHLLEMTQAEFFIQFQRAHPEIIIKQRSFEKLKPYFVRKLKDRVTCCCIRHVQICYLRDAVHQMRHVGLGFHGHACDCNCPICKADVGVGVGCSASVLGKASVTTVWESVLCAKQENAPYHAFECLMGACKNCSTQNLQCCPREVAEISKCVTAKIFEDVEVGVNKQGKKLNRKVVIHKEMSFSSLLFIFKKELQSFIRHNFICKWQAEQFKHSVLSFPHNVVVSVIDFAENYTFQEQNEIQSMHWHSSQITILVLITYIRVGSEAEKTIHFFISDDKHHDTLFVQHCFMLQHGWLKEQGLSLQEHWVWSDGAASQFKAKRPFYFVARYKGLTGLMMKHNFFGSGHGKGEHDGAGAVVKRAMAQEQLRADGIKLQCAADSVKYLRDHFRQEDHTVGKKSNVKRMFWEVELGSVDRSKTWECKAIPESRSLHCVCGYATSTLLKSRKLSCFCSACMQGKWRRCENIKYVDSWQYHIIEPTDDKEESDDEDCNGPLYEGHHVFLSDALSKGDNFAVNVYDDNNEEADFYILKCIEKKQHVKRAMKDKWGNVIAANTFVVRGHWYEQVGDFSYKLLDTDHEAILYAHLVKAIKFPMKLTNKNSKLYQITPEVHEAIYNSMPFEV